MQTDEATTAFVTTLRNHGIAGESCSEDMVRDVEQQVGEKLPAAYRAFLLLAGRGFPTWVGSHHTIDDILGVDDRFPPLQSWAESLLKHRKRRLPDSAFVFFVHQGAAVSFFLLDGGDNPPVFQWVDYQTPEPVHQIARSFTEHLIAERGLP